MKTGGRIAIPVTAADQLGPVVAVASHMKVGRTWLFALFNSGPRLQVSENDLRNCAAKVQQEGAQ